MLLREALAGVAFCAARAEVPGLSDAVLSEALGDAAWRSSCAANRAEAFCTFPEAAPYGAASACLSPS